MRFYYDDREQKWRKTQTPGPRNGGGNGIRNPKEGERIPFIYRARSADPR